MFDVGAPELLVLAVLAVILFGPEKLPEFARKAARVINYVRNVAGNAQQQLKDELGPEFLVGDPSRNYHLPTAVGALRPTALAQPSMVAGDAVGGGAEVARQWVRARSARRPWGRCLRDTGVAMSTKRL